jgi:hypothetical protein
MPGEKMIKRLFSLAVGAVGHKTMHRLEGDFIFQFERIDCMDLLAVIPSGGP